MLMAEVKFTQLVGYFCDNPPHNRYYRTIKDKQAVLIRRMPMPDIKDAYRSAIVELMG
jgi:hypothetical protein